MSEDLHARLKRLRREGEPTAPDKGTGVQPRRTEARAGEGPELPDDAGSTAPRRSGAGRALPPWVGRRLGRRGSVGTALAGGDAGTGQRASAADRWVEPATLTPRATGMPAALHLETGPVGDFAARIESFSDSSSHGDWVLSEIDACDSDAFALLCGDAALAGLDPRDCVYLDTETTGLGGGAGVYVYMIGLGYFEGDDFRLWQGFLRDPGEERALLTEAARLVRARSGVVSFFGKSFDRHRLDDKMAICGVDSPFDDRPHLDLYHPFQRLTRGALADGRLATMESTLCGLAREDDLPGALAPEAWFDFLAGRAHRLEGVFRHNRDDVLSLVTLAAYLGRVLVESRVDGSVLPGPAAARARGIARSHSDQGERRLALEWVERAVGRESASGRAPGRDLLFSRAELLRHLAEYTAALAAYAALDGVADRFALRGLIERAKILEHRSKDPARALKACRAALDLVPAALPGRLDQRRMRKELDHRAARLAGKLG